MPQRPVPEPSPDAPRPRRASTRPPRRLASLVACLCAALAAAAFALAPARAHAQVDRLDPHILIDALADEGMSELLLHLVETEPPDDPVVARQVEIAQHRMRFRDRTLDREQRHEALQNALEVTRRAVDEFRDHYQRPIWQTDLAELRLTSELQAMHEQAQLFYEFGVATAEQEAAFAEAAVEALAATIDANLRLFELRGDIGRDEDLSRELRQSGMFDRLFEEYEPQRNPFFLAQAAYAVTLLPDDHAYFRNLGGHDVIVDQESTPTDERHRLRELAVEQLEPFVTGTVDAPGAQVMALALSGRALVRLDRISEGLELLERAVDDAESPHVELIAELSRAVALHEQGDADLALLALEDLAEHELVTSQPLFRLLLTDAEHRLLLAGAEAQSDAARTEAIAAAYRPYMALLDDADRTDDGDALRHYIYRRWERTVGDEEDLSDHPPVVRLGIAQMSRIEGQRAVQQARRQEQEPAAEAIAKLERAIALCEPLVAGEASEAVRASALFNQAIATYWLAPDRIGTRLATAGLFTDLAEAFPDHGRAENAIATAVAMLRGLHRLDGRPEEVDAAYRRAAELLFDQYVELDAAADERLYFGFSVLHAEGRHEEAIAMYERVPRGHGDYFEAQRERVYALRELFRQAAGDDRDEAADRVRRAAERLGEEAEAAIAAGEHSQRARRAAAGALLVRADVTAAAGEPDRALGLLDDFEQEYPEEDDLVREALEQRILMLIEAGEDQQQLAREAAAQSDRREHAERAEALMGRAVEQARRMMQRFPDDAAAVIDEVLVELEQRIDRQRAEAADAVRREAEHLRASANQMAHVAAELADTLVEWARGQDFDEEQMIAFELIQAKSLRLAGEPERAVSVLEPLMQRFGGDAELIHEYAEARFAEGGDEALQDAARHYDQLITGLQPPYPSLWWNAWMRRLQINDQLGQATDTIAMRVRQLRQTDPDLGGPPYRGVLERLEGRHSR